MRQSAHRRDLDQSDDELGLSFVIGVFIVVLLLAAAWWYAFGGNEGHQATNRTETQGPAARAAEQVSVAAAPADDVVRVGKRIEPARIQRGRSQTE